MRGPKDYGVAVRKANGEIVTKKEDVDSILGKFKWLNRPFLRGTLAMIDSMFLGMRALMYSADIAMQDAAEADNAGQPNSQQDANVVAEAVSNVEEAVYHKGDPKSGSINDIAINLFMVLGLAAGLALFFFIPILIVKPIKAMYHMAQWQSAGLEGLIKILVFVLYVAGISFMKDIRRVFQYHGAEHKTINAYEDGAELTVDAVRPYTKVHVRCGTSFILVVLFTSIVVFTFVPWNSILERFIYKILLLPVIAGIAYEVIKFAGKFKESFATKLLTFPGLLMQKITTREPDPEMIEVAIASLKCVLEKEAERDIEAQTA